ncbi:MAG: TrkA family potassium uptake protein [Actinomycetaceae bacterium]|nr:TrkA family potassium uptake protein [Actinomycetaceae bacterium]
MAKKDSPESNATLVIGLGRFGSAVAATLNRLGREILALEKDPVVISKWQGRLPLIEADASNIEALEQVGVREFQTAVVGVGTSLESSVLITANLVDVGLPSIWAKATSREHGRILKRIGAHHVVYPEFDAGQRTAHLVSGRMLDYIEMDRKGFSIVKMIPPQECYGFTLAELDIRARFGVVVLGVMTPGHPFEYATSATRIDKGDIIIVSGDTDLLEKFAQRP